jgi:peptidoglycan/LPS O-acetylase OafA/YrhL
MKNQSISETKFYFSFIDGLRGIAVLMVLLIHTSQRVGNDHLGSFSFKISEIVVNFGARGVQLFFILSAFTLFNSSRARYLIDKYPKIDFYLRRIFRILPFWILMVLVMAFLSGSIHDIYKILINITFAFGFIRFQPNIELVPPAWSLFVEETFYLMLPFLFIYIKDIFKAFKFFIITLFLAVLWFFFARKFNVPNSGEFIFLFPFSHWFAFAIGILLYFLINNESFKKFILNVPSYSFLLDGLAFIALIVALLVSSIWYTYVVATFALTFMFIASVPKSSFFGKMARNKLLMRFGVYCYSIYLFHIPLLTALEPLASWLFSKIGISQSIVEIKLLVWFPVLHLFHFV